MSVTLRNKMFALVMFWYNVFTSVICHVLVYCVYISYLSCSGIMCLHQLHLSCSGILCLHQSCSGILCLHQLFVMFWYTVDFVTM